MISKGPNVRIYFLFTLFLVSNTLLNYGFTEKCHVDYIFVPEFSSSLSEETFLDQKRFLNETISSFRSALVPILPESKYEISHSSSKDKYPILGKGRSTDLYMVTVVDDQPFELNDDKDFNQPIRNTKINQPKFYNKTKNDKKSRDDKQTILESDSFSSIHSRTIEAANMLSNYINQKVKDGNIPVNSINRQKEQINVNRSVSRRIGDVKNSRKLDSIVLDIMDNYSNLEKEMIESKQLENTPGSTIVKGIQQLEDIVLSRNHQSKENLQILLLLVDEQFLQDKNSIDPKLFLRNKVSRPQNARGFNKNTSFPINKVITIENSELPKASISRNTNISNLYGFTKNIDNKNKNEDTKDNIQHINRTGNATDTYARRLVKIPESNIVNINNEAIKDNAQRVNGNSKIFKNSTNHGNMVGGHLKRANNLESEVRSNNTNHVKINKIGNSRTISNQKNTSNILVSGLNQANNDEHDKKIINSNGETDSTLNENNLEINNKDFNLNEYDIANNYKDGMKPEEIDPQNSELNDDSVKLSENRIELNGMERLVNVTNRLKDSGVIVITVDLSKKINKNIESLSSSPLLTFTIANSTKIAHILSSFYEEFCGGKFKRFSINKSDMEYLTPVIDNVISDRLSHVAKKSHIAKPYDKYEKNSEFTIDKDTDSESSVRRDTDNSSIRTNNDDEFMIDRDTDNESGTNRENDNEFIIDKEVDDEREKFENQKYISDNNEEFVIDKETNDEENILEKSGNENTKYSDSREFTIDKEIDDDIEKDHERNDNENYNDEISDSREFVIDREIDDDAEKIHEKSDDENFNDMNSGNRESEKDDDTLENISESQSLLTAKTYDDNLENIAEDENNVAEKDDDIISNSIIDHENVQKDTKHGFQGNSDNSGIFKTSYEIHKNEIESSDMSLDNNNMDSLFKTNSEIGNDMINNDDLANRINLKNREISTDKKINIFSRHDVTPEENLYNQQKIYPKKAASNSSSSVIDLSQLEVPNAQETSKFNSGMINTLQIRQSGGSHRSLHENDTNPRILVPSNQVENGYISKEDNLYNKKDGYVSTQDKLGSKSGKIENTSVLDHSDGNINKSGAINSNGKEIVSSAYNKSNRVQEFLNNSVAYRNNENNKINLKNDNSEEDYSEIFNLFKELYSEQQNTGNKNSENGNRVSSTPSESRNMKTIDSSIDRKNTNSVDNSIDGRLSNPLNNPIEGGMGRMEQFLTDMSNMKNLIDNNTYHGYENTNKEEKVYNKGEFENQAPLPVLETIQNEANTDPSAKKVDIPDDSMKIMTIPDNLKYRTNEEKI